MVMNLADQPYMGVREVADYLNSTRQTVWNWSQSGDFPKPIATLRMGPVWATDAIVKFKANRSRRPRKLNVREMAERGVPLLEIAKTVLRVRGIAD